MTKVPIHFFVLLLLLIVLAGAIHIHAQRAIAPPIYDALGYMHKSKSVWNIIKSLSLVNPLNVQPTSRPPGCVPFSYPFGYTPNFKTYIFYNSFFPIAIWILALWHIMASQCDNISQKWLAVCICAGFATMPMFYHFELSSLEDPFTGYWGLQDCLIASLAALSASLILVAVKRQSIIQTISGWFVGSYTILVKPSGILVMLSLLGIFVVEGIIGLLAKTGQRSKMVSYNIKSFITGCVIFSATLIACRFSQYLSDENIKGATTAQKLLLSLSDTSSLWALILPYIRPTIGWYWFILLACVFVVGIIPTINPKKRIILSYFRQSGMIFIMLAAGLWWLLLSGPQVRYLYPFILIIIIWLVFDRFELIKSFKLCFQIGLSGISVVSMLMLLYLLYSGEPNLSLQRIFGYNLSSGLYKEEVIFAEKLLEDSFAKKRAIVIYDLDSSGGAIVFSVDYLRSIIDSNKPASLLVHRPNDWVRAPGVRVEELIASDYVLYDQISGTFPVEGSEIATYQQEIAVIKAWLSTLYEPDGVVRTSAGKMAILKIQNHRKLLGAFKSLQYKFVWRTDFLVQNKKVVSVHCCHK